MSGANVHRLLRSRTSEALDVGTVDGAVRVATRAAPTAQPGKTALCRSTGLAASSVDTPYTAVKALPTETRPV